MASTDGVSDCDEALDAGGGSLLTCTLDGGACIGVVVKAIFTIQFNNRKCAGDELCLQLHYGTVNMGKL